LYTSPCMLFKEIIAATYRITLALHRAAIIWLLMLSGLLTFCLRFHMGEAAAENCVRVHVSLLKEAVEIACPAAPEPA
jgi:hypothetical protein